MPSLLASLVADGLSSTMNFNYSAVAAVNIDNSYVLDVAAAPSAPLVAAACSSGAVKVFCVDPSSGGLTAQGTGGAGGAGKNATSSSSSSSFAHTKPATSLAWHSGSASLLSASKDGTVACWDVRLGGSSSGKAGGSGGGPPPAMRLQAREPLHSVCFVEESRPVSSSSLSPNPSAPTTSTTALVAAGGDGKIFLWDARTGRELAAFEETHEGDVSVLLRAPVRPTIRADDGSLRGGGGGAGGSGGGSACFLSAGVDGLVAVWDVSLSHALNAAAAVVPSRSLPNNNNDNDEDEDEAKTLEDEAFVTALNTNTSVSRMGLLGAAGAAPLESSSSSSSSSLHLWATTGVEGMLTWDWGAACDEADAAGGVGPSSLVDDARGGLRKRKEGGAAAKGGGSGGSSSSSYDYVVGCVPVAGAASSPSSILLLAAGDHSGRLALFPLGPPAARGGAPTFLSGCSSPMTVPAGTSGRTGKPFRGHSATVRALAAVEAGAGGGGGRPLLATGGEDGLVVLWAPGGGGSGGSVGVGGSSFSDDEAANNDAQRDFSTLRVSAAADGVTKKKKKRRHKPQKKNKGGGGDGGGGGGASAGAGAAVDMAVE